MYVASPWSRGGWVNSQTFDHTSVAQFIEKRFGIVVPAISPWHRAVCGDLTSAFDFTIPDATQAPQLPAVHASATLLAAAQRPKPVPPAIPAPLFQEAGMRPSRALPYELHVVANVDAHEGSIALAFKNSGKAGAVFHVYDRLHLERIPRRYTVEAGKALSDIWRVSDDDGQYDLWVLGPNGFLREISGRVMKNTARTGPEVEARYDVKKGALQLTIINHDRIARRFAVAANAYRSGDPWSFMLAPGGRQRRAFPLAASFNWYDFIVTSDGFARRFAGRIETGVHGMSDPAIGT
jgi:phospholipase C